MSVDDVNSEIPSKGERITVISSIPEHARRPIQQRIEPLNMAIQEALGDEGLDLKLANMVMMLPDNIYNIPSNIADPAADVLVPILGLPDATGSYDRALRTRDVKAAMTLARFAIDPRPAIAEYDSIPWMETVQEYSEKGRSVYAKPRFSTIVEGIASVVVSGKIAALIPEVRRVISSSYIDNRTGEYEDPLDQQKYETMVALSQVMFDQPVDLMGIPKERWGEFQRKSLAPLKAARELHNNSILLPESGLHQAVVDLRKSPGGRLEIKGQHVPLVTLLRPTKPLIQVR